MNDYLDPDDDQPPLFELRAHARHGDPETSHEAADSLTSDKIRASQLAVLKVLRYYGPLTDADLVPMFERYAQRFGLAPQSPSGIRTRRNELTEQGRVEDTGRRDVLPSGRRAIVWQATGNEGQ